MEIANLFVAKLHNCPCKNIMLFSIVDASGIPGNSFGTDNG